MKTSFKKLSINTPAPKRGLGKFAKTSTPKLAPLKTRIYTKDILKTDPSAYGNIGFGDTALNETPSLLGMKRTSGL